MQRPNWSNGLGMNKGKNSRLLNMLAVTFLFGVCPDFRVFLRYIVLESPERRFQLWSRRWSNKRQAKKMT